ncbi:hypothetical protein [Leisingera sp. M658]|uniref:hypothetical protein n=1 Tax=Leisingera sp. M658 TaxID=2867015 RepID=UPI0021A86771|nr:hypothetical protein [Leisingera sp. M658]UWQ77083.1 hypothetical protein K3724_21610 [Leisingera sp. M658]
MIISPGFSLAGSRVRGAGSDCVLLDFKPLAQPPASIPGVMADFREDMDEVN